ncbi:MAG: MaoC/PaaZ C-terminal domain-containing protein [Halovenus sp.]
MWHAIGRTVTETDLVNQASLSGDWSEYHTNEEYTRENLFGERIAQAPLTFSISMGLMTNAEFLARTSAGLAAMDGTSYPQPVGIDDTVSVTITVTDTDRDDEGIVELEMETTNQGAEIVFETATTLFVRRQSRPD